MNNKKLDLDIEEIAIQNANNFGTPSDIFHPEYGWLWLDGAITTQGIKFFKDQNEKAEERTK